mmetsp:Transcript_29931/g.43599  ORF Transcript_29931/g.43599 Transcript_29931/m.43599 type:complete len:94 (+) Transcript_29931:862-1143(+)
MAPTSKPWKSRNQPSVAMAKDMGMRKCVVLVEKRKMRRAKRSQRRRNRKRSLAFSSRVFDGLNIISERRRHILFYSFIVLPFFRSSVCLIRVL